MSMQVQTTYSFRFVVLHSFEGVHLAEPSFPALSVRASLEKVTTFEYRQCTWTTGLQGTQSKSMKTSSQSMADVTANILLL